MRQCVDSNVPEFEGCVGWAGSRGLKAREGHVGMGSESNMKTPRYRCRSTKAR